MADPQVLYIVAGAVVLGLVAWVLVVLLRPGPEKQARPESSARSAAAPRPASSPAPPTGTRPSDRPKLDSHAEIRDDPGAKPVRGLQTSEDEDAGP